MDMSKSLHPSNSTKGKTPSCKTYSIPIRIWSVDSIDVLRTKVPSKRAREIWVRSKSHQTPWWRVWRSQALLAFTDISQRKRRNVYLTFLTCIPSIYISHKTYGQSWWEMYLQLGESHVTELYTLFSFFFCSWRLSFTKLDIDLID